MLCIDNHSTNPYLNLATEEYMLKNFSDDVFMVWQNRPTVVIGKHQNVWNEINLEFVKKNKIDVVRRYSGGGAVYHDLGNVNITFIESNDKIDFDKYVKQVVKLLRTIGLDAKADKRRALTINELKISGSAQCIHRNKMMYHATLLFSSDLDMLLAALNSENNSEHDKRYVQSVRSKVTNICDQMSQPVSIGEFKDLIMKFFLNSSIKNTAYMLNDKDIKAIKQLNKEKYATNDWNLNKQDKPWQSLK